MKKAKPVCERILKKPTKWLYSLPAGSYTISELEKLTNRHVSTIKQRLNFLEIPKSYNSSTGYPLVVYHWMGIQAYKEQHPEDFFEEEFSDNLIPF